MNRSALLGGASPVAAGTLAPPRVAVAPAAKAPLVAILIPSDDDWKADMSMAVAGLMTYTAANRIARITLFNQKASMITMSRNDLVERALEAKADYVLFVDSDMKFPHDAIQRLMAHDKDIVGATYNKRVPPFETLGRIMTKPGLTPQTIEMGGLHEAEYLPGGFVMIKTEVFRKTQWPWFFECFNRLGAPMDAFIGMLRDVFMLTPTVALEKSLRENAELQRWLAEDWPLEPANRIMSEDYSFMRKARRAGFSIWCDVTLTWQMVHIGQQDITCVPKASVLADPAAPAAPIVADRVPLPAGRPPSIVTV